MCIILDKPRGVPGPTPDMVTDFYRRNPDGWGVMLATKAGPYVRQGLTLDGLIVEVARLGRRAYTLHCRMRTHGAVDRANAHPFRVISQEEGGPVWVMHNGIINVPSLNPHRSDTWHFVEYYLRPLLLRCPTLPESRVFRDMLGSWIGQGNKLAILDATGKVWRINENSGVWFEGAWYSNTYAWAHPPTVQAQEARWLADAEARAQVRAAPGGGHHGGRTKRTPGLKAGWRRWPVDDVCTDCLAPRTADAMCLCRAA